MQNLNLEAVAGRNFTATVSSSHSLQSILDEVARRETVTIDGKSVTRNVYGNDDTWEISIPANLSSTYTTVKKKIPTIKCNIILKGTGSSKSKIYFDKAIVAETNTGDTVLNFQGDDFEHRIFVRIINLEFMQVGYPTVTNLTKEVEFENQNLLIKIYFAKEVVMYNCKSTLRNGPISNLDIRIADNITIDKCHFINDNALSARHSDTFNTTGCILQIRGEVNNVRVSNNTFDKYGNDEALGIFGGSIAEGGMESKTPEWKKDYITRRNIEVYGNTFNYRYASINGGTVPTADKMAVCGVLISLLGLGDSFVQNVDYSFNTVKCTAPVQRVFMVSEFGNNKKNLNIKFHDNTIEHEYSFLSTDVNKGAMVIDFAVLNAEGGVTSSEPIEIFNNTAVSKETIGPSYNGHINVQVVGTYAKVYDNTFDGTGHKLSNPLGGQAKGTIVMQVSGVTSQLVFSGNSCTGVGILGQITSGKNNSVFDIELSDNYVDGVSKLFFRAVPEVNLRLFRNYFRSTSYELLAQQFAQKGSLWVSDNVWDTQAIPGSTNNGSMIYANYDTSLTVNLDRVTFISNIIGGVRTLGSVNQLPPAKSKVIANNQINQQFS